MIGATDSVVLLTDGAATVDAEGRTTRTATETTVADARVDELSARDVEIAARSARLMTSRSRSPPGRS